jgi:putative oxidoreductase
MYDRARTTLNSSPRRSNVLGRFLNAKFVPTNTDAGILLLRIGTGFILFMRHGWEKVSTLTLLNPHFPDPLHIGHNTSWVLAMLSDGILSLLVILGLGTRWIAVYSFVEIFVAWAFVHHFSFLGKSPAADHGELIALYLSAFLALMVTGSGRYSLDAMLAKEPEPARRVAHA